MQNQGVMFVLLDGVLNAVEKIDGMSASLDDVLDDSEKIPLHVRRTAAYWLFSIYRYRADIENYIRDFSQKGKIKKPLFKFAVAAAAHCAFQNKIAKELSVNAIVQYAKSRFGISESRFINALLRKICREQPQFSARLPQNIADRWRKTFGNEFVEQAQKCLGTEVVQTFRLRPGFEVDIKEAVKINDVSGGKFTFCQTHEIDKVIESDVFANGGIYIQDIATGAAVELLSRYISSACGRFIDVCGAPGGKAIMFHDLFPEWEIYIGDRSARRQQRTAENLERCKVNAKIITLDAGADELPAKFDVVFADVPCSNSGVFRKRPDVFCRLNEESLQEIASIQCAILENIYHAVVKNGLLLYSTCSIEEAEDGRQIAEFCARHPEFELLEERLLLPTEECDGAYSACLRRIK